MSVLETIWENLLSRDAQKTRAVFLSLDEPSRREVLAHLQAMTSAAGWHANQELSARAALQALEADPGNQASGDGL